MHHNRPWCKAEYAVELGGVRDRASRVGRSRLIKASMRLFCDWPDASDAIAGYGNRSVATHKDKGEIELY